LGLLIGPSLVWEAWQARSLKVLRSMALGQLPFLTWEMFSIIYYGFPFPNTAYAKLNLGIAKIELAKQGGRYLLHSLIFDPVTLVGMLLATYLLIRSKRPRAWMLAGGIVAYLLYVVRIGGDFMAGRHLTAPLFFAVCNAAILPMVESSGKRLG